MMLEGPVAYEKLAGHLENLQNAGLSIPEIASLAGLLPWQIDAMCMSRHRPRTELAIRVLWINVSEVFDPAYEKGWMEGDYVWALAEELHNSGFTRAQLAKHLGMPDLKMGKKKVTARIGMSVERLYRQVIGDPEIVWNRLYEEKTETQE